MSDEVFNALLEIKEDTGATRAKIEALEGWMRAHVEEDKAAHGRILQLEMVNERRRGAATVMHLIAVAIGSAAGWAGQLFVSWLKHR